MPENILGNFDVNSKISKINIPVIILHGEDDEIMDVRNSKRMRELFPNSKLITFPNVKHDINKEVSDLVADNIISFFLNYL